jgi:hypothetical protein
MEKQDISFLRYCFGRYGLGPCTRVITKLTQVLSGLSLHEYLKRAVPRDSPDYARLINKYVHDGEKFTRDEFRLPGESFDAFALLYTDKFMLDPPGKLMLAEYSVAPADVDMSTLERQLDEQVFYTVRDWRIPEWEAFRNSMLEHNDFQLEPKRQLMRFKRTLMDQLQTFPQTFDVSLPNLAMTKEALDEQMFVIDPVELMQEVIAAIPKQRCQESSMHLILTNYLQRYTLNHLSIPENRKGERFTSYVTRVVQYIKYQNDRYEDELSSIDQTWITSNAPNALNAVVNKFGFSERYVEDLLELAPFSMQTLVSMVRGAKVQTESINQTHLRMLRTELEQSPCHVDGDVYALYLKPKLQQIHRRRLMDVKRGLDAFDFDSYHTEQVREAREKSLRHKRNKLCVDEINAKLRLDHEREVEEYERERERHCQLLLDKVKRNRTFLNYSSSKPPVL